MAQSMYRMVTFKASPTCRVTAIQVWAGDGHFQHCHLVLSSSLGNGACTCPHPGKRNLAKPMAAFALLRLPANLSNPRQIRPRAAALLPGTRMHGGACGPGPVWRVPGRVHATDWPCEKHRSAYSVGLMRSGTPATHAQFLFGKFRQATVVAQGLHGVRACSGQEFTPPSSAGGAASLKKEADKAC